MSMSQPVRLRLSRAKGFDLQAHSREANGLPAITVARPSRWGNRWVIRRGAGGYVCVDTYPDGATIQARDEADARDLAISLFRGWMGERPAWMIPRLAGRNLACWCRLDQPCHADVLLQAVNR